MNPKIAALLASTALLLSLCALELSTIEESQAGRALPGPSLKPRRYGILRLNRKKQFPARVIPKVRRAGRTDRLGNRRARDYLDRCSAETVDLGTVCLVSSPYPLEREEIGKNNYFFATQKCVDLGGYLPPPSSSSARRRGCSWPRS